MRCWSLKRVLAKPWLFAAIICFFILTGVTGVGASGAPSKNVVNCPAKISWDITDSAKVTQFQCTVKPFKGKDMLQYFIEIQNTGDQAHRYRVHIINSEGKSVGGLLPRKGKPPVVKAGEKAKFTYPVAGYLQVPDKLEVMVTELH